MSDHDGVEQVIKIAWRAQLKTELAERFASCGEAKMELFDYIEVFYNQRRRHSTLGLISPAAFERQAAMDAAVPVDAENASTVTWKTAKNAVSHSAHSLSSSTEERRLMNEDQLTQPVH